MTQLSLVAGYGAKNPPYADRLARVLDSIRLSALGPYFQPYAVEQIHGTIVGMERAADQAGFANANLLARRGAPVAMKFDRIVTTLRRHLPMNVRFGGFAPNEAPFLSSGRTPHERAFQIQWATRRCTLIGWPHRAGDFTTQRPLLALRDDLERHCGLGHKYPEDNDFFMVLGLMELPERVTPEEVSAVQRAASVLEMQLREHLAENPFDLVIELPDIRIVAYDDVTLPPASTRAYALSDLDPLSGWIESLYA